MKKNLTRVLVVCNVVCLVGLLWMRSEHQSTIHNVVNAAMRGDELHLRLHASSLSALESDDADEVMTAVIRLHAIIAAGDRNIAARRHAGLGR